MKKKPERSKFPMILAQWFESEDAEWRVVALDPMNGDRWTMADVHLSLERNEGPDAMGNAVWCEEGFGDSGGEKFAAFFDEMLKSRLKGTAQ